MSETTTAPVRARPAKKKKKNQLPIGLGVFALMIVIGVLLAVFKSGMVAMFWLFGGCFGFILQKSRFCFTASLRDPCITGSTSLTKAVQYGTLLRLNISIKAKQQRQRKTGNFRCLLENP